MARKQKISKRQGPHHTYASLVTAASDAIIETRKEYGKIEELSLSAARNEIGGRHNGPTEAALDETGIKKTRDRRELVQVKAQNRIMSMKEKRPVRQLLKAASKDKNIMGDRWLKAAKSACKAGEEKLGHKSSKPKTMRNKMLNEIFSKVHEKRTKKKKERPQSVFPALVHAARMKKHGHKYPAVTSWPHTVLGYSMQRQITSSAHFFNGCTHLGGEVNNKKCPHCGASMESEEHVQLRCPKYKPERLRLLENTGWPRNEEQLTKKDAVRWMVPDASKAKCSEGKMAKSIQEFCQAIAWTRGDRKMNEDEE